MTIEHKVRLLAGIVILVSLTLAILFSTNWLWITAFAGLNLVQSAFTGFCPPETLFKWLEKK